MACSRGCHVLKVARPLFSLGRVVVWGGGGHNNGMFIRRATSSSSQIIQAKPFAHKGPIVVEEDEEDRIFMDPDEEGPARGGILLTKEEKPTGKSDTKGSQRFWGKLCKKFPQLEGVDKQERIIGFIELLSVYGIPSDAVAEMVIKYPTLLSMSPEKIVAIINTLRSCGFKEEHRTKLLRKWPGIVELSQADIKDRIAFLNTYFDNTGESVKVCLNSAEALSEANHIVKMKLRYLIMDMSHSTSSIKNCSALSFSLRHMKMRHAFLIRAGLYQPIPYKNLVKVREKEKGSKTARPRYSKPEDVVCTSDKQFLKLCTKNVFTANDLAAFEELYVSQIEEDEEDDNDFSDLEEKDDGTEDDATDVINSVAFGYKADRENFYF